jgi:hypothetical protein
VKFNLSASKNAYSCVFCQGACPYKSVYTRSSLSSVGYCMKYNFRKRNKNTEEEERRREGA